MQLFIRAARLLCALLLVSAVILSATGCTAQSFDSIVINSIRSSVGGSNSARVYSDSGGVRLASSDSAELYFNEKNGGISLISLYTGKKWTSLPIFENSFAASFIMKVTDGETVYVLDSSADIKNNKPSVRRTENGAVVTYALKWDVLSISLPVEFSLKGAALEVSVNMADIVSLSDGLTVLSVSVLPFFGAVRYSSADDYSVAGDFFLVPDGVGALMCTAVEDENTALTFSVYGKDYYEDNIPASVGAYGIVQDGAGLSATVTAGAENALIRVFRAGNDDKNVNRIYPEFIITPVSGEKGTVNVGKSYSGRLSVTYEVLSSENASYTDISASVRQSLIRAGLLAADKCENEYPLTISFAAGADGKRSNTTASYQQIENLLGILKGKGINEVNAVLSGAFGDGPGSSVAGNARLRRALGSKNDLRSLLNFTQSQNFNMFAEANLLSAESSLYCEKGVSGEYKTSVRINPLSPYIGEEAFTLKYLSARGVLESTNNVLGFIGKNGFSGVALADTGIACHEEDGSYADYSALLQNCLSAISAEAKLMLSGTSANIIRNADYLYNLPFGTAVQETEYYTAVPFIPAVLHGSLVYAGEPLNTSSVSAVNFLKAVEYGAVPHYLWCFDESSDKYYEYSVNEAVEFCLRAKAELSDLMSERITGHEKLADGVYCTSYESGARVFVNYNNYSVIMGDVSVMPYDYLRIG